METNNGIRENNGSKFQNPLFLKSLFPTHTYFQDNSNIKYLERVILFLEHQHPDTLEKVRFNPQIHNIYTLAGFLENVFPDYPSVQEFENSLKINYEAVCIEEFFPIYLDDILYIKPIELKIGFAYFVYSFNEVVREFNWEKGIQEDHFEYLFEMELYNDDLEDDELNEIKKTLKLSTREISKMLNKVKKYYNYDIQRFLDYNPKNPVFQYLKERLLCLLNIDIIKAFSLECPEYNFPYQDCFKLLYIEGNIIQERINEDIDTYAQEGISNPLSSFIVSDTVEIMEDKEAIDELGLLMNAISDFRKIIRKIVNGKS